MNDQANEFRYKSSDAEMDDSLMDDNCWKAMERKNDFIKANDDERQKNELGNREARIAETIRQITATLASTFPDIATQEILEHEQPVMMALSSDQPPVTAFQGNQQQVSSFRSNV